ncbi:hypothetical protein VPFG_00303 [Vibrio phage nt-1]|uniref:Uncharacterized protein n=1 Tax=Vibrio phage nt-1 TaxID=115992 RepID=R9TJM2_9CAUD|nr:hypothetical protein VPFG_00303 [Vibrio phage nt-1]AGN30302.2 hypothetical protein VPFG_00303 [Vibrio phage nt-1]
MMTSDEMAKEMIRVRSAVNLFDTCYSLQDAYQSDQRLMAALPENVRFMWQKRDEMNEAVFAEISRIEKRIDKTLCEINDPLHAIGKRVVKKSRKPFKGGEDVVRVTGITKHPEIDEYAFTYNYSKDDGSLGQSYIYTKMVTIDYSDMEL